MLSPFRGFSLPLYSVFFFNEHSFQTGEKKVMLLSCCFFGSSSSSVLKRSVRTTLALFWRKACITHSFSRYVRQSYVRSRHYPVLDLYYKVRAQIPSVYILAFIQCITKILESSKSYILTRYMFVTLVPIHVRLPL